MKKNVRNRDSGCTARMLKEAVRLVLSDKNIVIVSSSGRQTNDLISSLNKLLRGQVTSMLNDGSGKIFVNYKNYIRFINIHSNEINLFNIKGNNNKEIRLFDHYSLESLHDMIYKEMIRFDLNIKDNNQ